MYAIRNTLKYIHVKYLQNKKLELLNKLQLHGELRGKKLFNKLQQDDEIRENWNNSINYNEMIN